MAPEARPARPAGGELSIATQFQAVGSGYYMSLGKKGDARLAPRRWASSVGSAMRILKPFTSNTRLITLCSRCHHSEFLHSDPTGGPGLFSECVAAIHSKAQRKDSREAHGELSS